MPPVALRPWFKAPDRKHLSHTIVFGHWSSLGQGELRPHHLRSIPARFWGGELTAIDLASNQITQVPSANGLDWKATQIKIKPAALL